MELCSEVRRRLLRYLEEGEGRTLRQLSKVSGVPYPNIWAVSKGNARPSFAHVLALCAIIATPEETAELLERHFPDEAKSAARIYGLTRPALGGDVSRGFLNDAVGNHILTLACTRAGVTRERVRQLHGETGLTVLDDLVAHELVTAGPDGRYRGALREFSTHHPSDAISSFRTRLGLMRKEHFGTPNALLGMLTESVTAEAQKRIRGILGNALVEVYAILSDPANAGPKAIFVGAVLSLLDDPAQDARGTRGALSAADHDSSSFTFQEV